MIRVGNSSARLPDEEFARVRALIV